MSHALRALVLVTCASQVWVGPDGHKERRNMSARPIAAYASRSPAWVSVVRDRWRGSLDRSSSLRLLETAFDAGITHFDVARSYGYYEAEPVLGEMIIARRDQVTMSKAGILPPVGSTL